jgi:hypothetical protein
MYTARDKTTKKVFKCGRDVTSGRGPRLPEM